MSIPELTKTPNIISARRKPHINKYYEISVTSS